MLNDNYNNIENYYYNKNTINPYSRNRRLIEDNNYCKNNEPYRYNLNKSANYNSPLKSSSNFIMRPTKTKRFQNENLVVYKVSPYHIQYRYKIYDDIIYRNENSTKDKINDEQIYNPEKERKYQNKNYNEYEYTPPNIRDNGDINKYSNYSEKIRNNYENISINNNTINYNNSNSNYIMNNNNKIINNNNDYNRNNYGVSRSQQIPNNRNYINKNNYNINNNYDMNNQMMFNDMNKPIRRNNSDFKYIQNRYNNREGVENNRYYDRETRENNRHYYLRKPIDNNKGEDVVEGYRHYSPERNDYHGSRYGGYIYNYYLNAPMRGDKSEDWRFPPLYYYDYRRKKYNNQA